MKGVKIKAGGEDGNNKKICKINWNKHQQIPG